MTGRGALIPFILLVVGGGLLIGFLTAPGPWYEALTKPSFNPPNWLFGPVWTVLYVLIAVAGWRIWRIGPSRPAMKLWWVQLALNFMWSPVFFGLQQIGLALVVIVALLICILAFIAAAWNLDRLSVWLFVPYAAWVSFASLLNGSIWFLN
ncbi:MAG TPA: TspO/MBR family protein [Rhizobiaceae bacterium]